MSVRVRGLTLEEATEEQAAVLRKLPPGGLSPFLAHAPALAEAAINTGMLLFDEEATGISDEMREALIIRIAHLCGGNYVEQQHKRLGQAFGMAPEQLQAASDGSSSKDLPVEWRAAFELVELGLRGTSVPEAVVSAVVGQYGERGLTGIAIVAGTAVQLSLLASWTGISA
ncbi:hypothetical protein [Novosphingobium sp.]|uniref:hypothetical protein n=1 Tax=Novosphingobium sp. TaxID=1874826 RepID=UPI002628A3BA|nr:hypothetical protein [Novosphingobium sp.]